MVQPAKPIEVNNKPKAQAREGNIALDVHRPLYETGKKWDYQALKKNLLAKLEDDEEKLPELAFLDGQDHGTDQDSVVLSSYPRSGNTLLRAYIEKITGIVSGSDCDITKKLNVALMNMGLAGEGLVDKRVMCIKTHYPERYGKTKFGAERCVLLVRSPLDCMTSLFNMVCSGSHDQSIADSDFEKFPAQWNEFIEQEVSVWKDFHNFWLKTKVPVHIVRYEDIVLNPAQTLEELSCFLLNIETVEGTRIKHYIKLATKEKAPEVYKPRKGLVNNNKRKFAPRQIDYMLEQCEDLLVKFGYTGLFKTKVPDDGSARIHTLPDPIQNVAECGDRAPIVTFNESQRALSIKNLYDSDEVTSVVMNYPALLLRKKSVLYPEGRTSHRFKRELRRQVTIVGKSAFKVGADLEDVPEEKAKAQQPQQQRPVPAGVENAANGFGWGEMTGNHGYGIGGLGGFGMGMGMGGPMMGNGMGMLMGKKKKMKKMKKMKMPAHRVMEQQEDPGAATRKPCELDQPETADDIPSGFSVMDADF